MLKYFDIPRSKYFHYLYLDVLMLSRGCAGLSLSSWWTGLPSREREIAGEEEEDDGYLATLPGAGLADTRGMTLPVLLFLTRVAGTISPLGSITFTSRFNLPGQTNRHYHPLPSDQLTISPSW